MFQPEGTESVGAIEMADVITEDIASLKDLLKKFNMPKISLKRFEGITEECIEAPPETFMKELTNLVDSLYSET